MGPRAAPCPAPDEPALVHDGAAGRAGADRHLDRLSVSPLATSVFPSGL
ncbi:Hypothetical protein A7982_07218 [Minicystis rosea]|nr:Hypothetical protein A7982_07218 [Minicystis rosea]